MSDEATGITVTIKYGKGYEDTWSVFKGDAARVRKDVMDYFGLTEEVTAGLTLHEVVWMATDVAHGNTALANALGATPIAQPATAAGEPRGKAAWGAAQSEPEEPAHPHAVLIERLKTAATVDDLKQLWARNQEAFTDPDVSAAYSARGKELTEA